MVAELPEKKLVGKRFLKTLNPSSCREDLALNHTTRAEQEALGSQTIPGQGTK